MHVAPGPLQGLIGFSAQISPDWQLALLEQVGAGKQTVGSRSALHPLGFALPGEQGLVGSGWQV